jgi:hypothetical protein
MQRAFTANLEFASKRERKLVLTTNLEIPSKHKRKELQLQSLK